ncbi:helix-turn-helix transcriptional regulator [Lachnospiraceae bacterium JLR.KK008]
MYSRLRDLREDKDLSQKDMSTILSMSQTGYSKYETGENDIPTAILVELAVYHNTSVDYLLNLTDIKQPYPRAKK